MHRRDKLEKEISMAVIRRLPRYYRYLSEINASGTERISSGELSSMMGVTASQIRQDLNNFGGFGQQGYGYNVANLRDEIGKLLGLENRHKMIIVGAGNFGTALAKFFSEYESKSYEIVALFDNKKELVGKQVGDANIYDLDDMADFIKKEKIKIGIITVPKDAAVLVADEMVKSGIEAIWNYAHVDLSVPDDVIVENVHLLDSLMTLTYELSAKDENSK